MRTDDLLTQIDAALDDWSVGPDAMRSNPAAPPPTRPARLAPGDSRAAGREILIQRLVERHGLSRPTALEVVSAIEAGRDSPHADLVRVEASAVMRETMGQIREALRPMFEAWTEAMRRLAERLQSAAAAMSPVDTKPGRRPDRPAWVSPYGPAPRRK